MTVNNRDFGRLEGKVDALLELVKTIEVHNQGTEIRITSLETTRTKQRAYWRALVITGSIIITILGKLLLFTKSVLVNIPVVPINQ